MRLDKYLTQCFIGTRKEVKNIIKQKRIYINDQLVTSESYNIDEKSDIVKFDNSVLKYQEKYYYILNKPAGFVTAINDAINPTIMDLFDKLPKLLKDSLFPVGRLDKDTEGLLVLTNDGQLAHRVLSPKKHVPKTYYAKIQGVVTEEDIVSSISDISSLFNIFNCDGIVSYPSSRITPFSKATISSVNSNEYILFSSA